MESIEISAVSIVLIIRQPFWILEQERPQFSAEFRIKYVSTRVCNMEKSSLAKVKQDYFSTTYVALSKLLQVSTELRWFDRMAINLLLKTTVEISPTPASLDLLEY